MNGVRARPPALGAWQFDAVDTSPAAALQPDQGGSNYQAHSHGAAAGLPPAGWHHWPPPGGVMSPVKPSAGSVATVGVGVVGAASAAGGVSAGRGASAGSDGPAAAAGGGTAAPAGGCGGT